MGRSVGRSRAGIRGMLAGVWIERNGRSENGRRDREDHRHAQHERVEQVRQRPTGSDDSEGCESCDKHYHAWKDVDRVI